MFTHCPEKLVPGKYNIIAVGGGEAAILWKDGQYFVIGDGQPGSPIPIEELLAYGIDAKGQYVHPDPIPLEDLSEWREVAALVDIPLTSIEKPYEGSRDFSKQVRALRRRRAQNPNRSRGARQVHTSRR